MATNADRLIPDRPRRENPLDADFAAQAAASRVARGLIGVAMTTTYVDARPPLVAGGSEVREYRAQGMAVTAQ